MFEFSLFFKCDANSNSGYGLWDNFFPKNFKISCIIPFILNVTFNFYAQYFIFIIFVITNARSSVLVLKKWTWLVDE